MIGKLVFFLFWDNFYKMCLSRGTKPNPVAKEIGISSGILTKWKTTGAIPSGESLIKIADYLDCSVDYLLGRTERDESMIRFDGVFGDAAVFTVKRTESGYQCFLNGQKVPAVLSEKLVIGEGVPKVVLEIAVRAYSGKTLVTELPDQPPISDGDIPDAKIEIGIRDGRAFFKDSLAAVRDSPNSENNSF